MDLVFRNMINTGLGRFGLKQKQPMPFDHDTVIIFFLGGISVAELRAMNKSVSRLSDQSMTFLCGGSSLLSPDDVLRMVCRP